MPQLRCLTIKAKEPRRLAAFYRRVFEVKTVSEDDSLMRLSDGVFTLGLFKGNGERKNGLNASGFRVEDLDGVKQKAARQESDAAPYSEARIADPDGNLIDLSRQSFGSSDEKSSFPIKHLALYTADPKRLSEFY